MDNADLIAKYLAGEATDAEKLEVARWRDSDPANGELLAKMSEAFRPRYPETDFSDTLENDWLLLKRSVDPRAGTPARPVPFWLKIAAAIFMIISAAIGSWFVTQDAGAIQEIAAADTVRHVVLADGTGVWLNRNSVLRVDNNFNAASRTLTLEGEGYFDVAHDATRPFIIRTGDVETRVLGTEFQVSADRSGSVVVTVDEGKVAVSGRGSAVTLTANEVAVYDVGSNKVSKTFNADPNYNSWRTGVLRFRNETLARVCTSLGRHYKTSIQPADSSLRGQKVTTVLDNVTLEDAISILANTLDLTVERTDSVIYLSR